MMMSLAVLMGMALMAAALACIIFGSALGNYPGGDSDSGGGKGFGGSASYGNPVLLDLDGNGLDITPLSSSNIFYDMAGDGYQHRAAWAGAGDGVLVLDTDGNGQITQRNQVVFTDWDPTAKDDMQALRDVFDTNHNGKLDAGDAQFSKFKILVTNADGTTTLMTLAQAGVVSINLIPDATNTVLPDGSVIQLPVKSRAKHLRPSRAATRGDWRVAA